MPLMDAPRPSTPMGKLIYVFQKNFERNFLVQKMLEAWHASVTRNSGNDILSLAEELRGLEVNPVRELKPPQEKNERSEEAGSRVEFGQGAVGEYQLSKVQQIHYDVLFRSCGIYSIAAIPQYRSQNPIPRASHKPARVLYCSK